MKNLMNRISAPVAALSAGAASLAVSGLAMAQTAPTNATELASAVDFADVGTALLAVAGVIISLYVTWKGAQFVIRAVRGA